MTDRQRRAIRDLILYMQTFHRVSYADAKLAAYIALLDADWNREKAKAKLRKETK